MLTNILNRYQHDEAACGLKGDSYPLPPACRPKLDGTVIRKQLDPYGRDIAGTHAAKTAGGNTS